MKNEGRNKLNINTYRIRLYELRKKINEILDRESQFLDDEELREAKEKNGRIVNGQDKL